MSDTDTTPRTGRFDGMFKNVKAQAAVEEKPTEPPQVAPPLPSDKDDNAQEPFSTTLTRGLKRALKQASAVEDRKQFEVIDQAVREYMERNHPRLLE